MRMWPLGRLALVAACWALAVRPATPLTAEEAAAAATRAAAGALHPSRVDRTDALDEDKKTDGKIGAGVSSRAGGAGARDQQLLSVLAARRRRLLRERLADHLTTIATLANKPNRNNATFAQLELRDSNSTVFKRIVLSDNNGPNLRNGTPVIRIETPVNLYREQQSRTTERPVTVSARAYQESKSRAGFLNNRRKSSTSDLPRYGSAFRKHPSSSDELLEQVEYTKKETVMPQYVPGEGKEENVESVILDPEEEFQVDESNHGLYLLNYSDTSNTTDKNNNHTLSTKVVDSANKSIQLTTESSTKLRNKSEEINTSEMSTTNVSPRSTTTTTTERVNRSVTEMNHATSNASDMKTTRPSKVESTTAKENENKTLFISDELSKHFRPLETELPVEEMEPFLSFGQKLNTPLILGDNLTNAPNLSASTKSVQYLNLPEKKRFPTRIPVTDKTKYLKVNDDEEINEDMDVSVVKNVIEKNKIRTSAKILSPLRHINPYRKLVPTSASKLINATHIIPQGPTLDISTNNTNQSSLTGRVREEIVNRTMYANVRNYTRIPYTTFKRRPVKVTPTSNINNSNVTQSTDTASTTDKPATLIYTAVVTSVSVTSSMKGHNKTDSMLKNNTDTEIKEENNTTINLPMHTQLLNALPLNNTSIKTENASNTTLVETKTEHQPAYLRPKVRTTTSRTTNITSSTPGPAILFSKFLNRTNKVRYKDTLDSIITSDFNKKVSNSSIPKINIRPIAVETRLGFDDFITNSFSETTVTQPPGPVTNTPFVIRYTTYQTSTEEKIENTVSNNDEKWKSQSEEVEIQNIANIASAVDYEAPPKPKVNIADTNSKVDKNISGRNKSASIHDSREKNDIVTAANDGVVIEAEKTYTATYVLAGLGFLPVTAIIVFVLRSVFLHKTKEIDTDYEGYFQDSEVKKESQVTPVARPPAPPPVKPDQKWEFPRNKLRLQTLLGQGNFGQVWKAEADDLSGHDGLTRLVAVKTIKESASQKEKQELLHEICIMQKLGTHPNVVTLLACCTEQEPYLLVMEYVMCGKLLTYLRERRSRPDRFGGGSGALAARDLTVFGYCVARGMDYLASKGIVHRDLAARNILVDHNKLCKVADFGMSRASAAGGAGGASGPVGAGGERRRHALPVRWMAPESLLYDLYSHETDVWAYGILLWEIVTLGSTPYASMSGREVLQVVTEGYRLERPAHCSPQLYRTMHACWHADAAQRPTFADIKGQLAALLDNEPTDGHYVDLDSFYQDSSVYSDPSAIINDDAGISIEYERELKPERATAELPRRSFHKSTTNLHRNLSSGNYDQRNITFTFRDTNFNQIRPNLHVSGINSPRMGGFGIRDMGFNTRENSFTDNVKLSSSSFHREQRESNRDNPVSKGNSFNGNVFTHNRMGSRDASREGRGFQLKTDGNRNKRVSEFECDI